MLGSPIQNNNLMNLLFSARKEGAVASGSGDVNAAQQQDFLKFLNTVKDAIQQNRTSNERPLEKIGAADKKSVNKTDKEVSTDNRAEAAEETESEKIEDPKKSLGKTLEDLAAILQQWQQQLSAETGNSDAEGENPDQKLSDALTALLEEIQALQATLPQPVLETPAPDLLSQINQQLGAIDPDATSEDSASAETPTEATGVFQSLWDQALEAVPTETIAETSADAIEIPAEQLLEQPEVLTELQPEPEVSAEQPSATLDSAKLEKLMVKVANIMEAAPEDAKAALQEVTTKVKSLADILAERPKGKSIQQMQFEAMLPASPAKASDDTASISSLNNITLMGAVSAHSVVEGLGQINGLNANAVGANAQFANGAPIPAPHEQVVEAATLSIQAGKKEISIKLMPSELGEVRMTLNSTSQNQISARLVAETPEAKQALEKNLDQLVRSLEASGLKIGKIQVMQAGQSESSNQFADGNNQQSNPDSSLFQQQRQQQQHQQQAFAMANNFNNGGNSNSFTDGGSSQAGDDASSSQSFDTDVEGEEVSSASIQDDGSVDVRI